MKTSVLISLSFCCALTALAQGSLIPPGAPGPTMKTLQQVEPRTPISSLPFTITNRGSYYVTTNLDSGGVGGIIIQTNDVVLDLNGFTLTSNGSLHGIAVPTSRNNIVVRNGIFRNWGTGVGGGLATQSSFENLHISGCNAAGITMGNHCQLTGSGVFGNTNFGVFAESYCLISRCHAALNGSSGIRAGEGSRIVGCTSAQNGGNGILLNGASSAVHDTVINNNLLVGISSPSSGGHTIKNCTVKDNDQHGIHVITCCNIVTGCNVIQNGWDGIRVENRSHVFGNLVHFNGALTNNSGGIVLTGANGRVEDNTLGNNDVGIIATASGTFIIRNHAHGNGTNYHLVGTQNAGPIVTSLGTITTNNPWANFSY